LIAVVSQPTRADLDDDRRPGRKISLSTAFAPLQIIFKSRALIELATIGFVYAATQVCLISFLVVYLTDALALSIVTAGIALTTANIGGIVGRIGFGYIADHKLAPRTTVAVIGLIAGTCAYVTCAFDATWPRIAILAVCAVFGMTAIGWNGVQLSEI